MKGGKINLEVNSREEQTREEKNPDPVKEYYWAKKSLIN